MYKHYNTEYNFLEGLKGEKFSEFLLSSIFGRLCLSALGCSDASSLRNILDSEAERLYKEFSSETGISKEKILQCADLAFQFVARNISKAKEELSQRKKSVPPIVKAVDNFLAASPDVYISPERKEMFLVENGFLRRYAPEEIAELRLPCGYSSSEKYRLFSLLQQKLEPNRVLSDSEQSLDSLVPESACVFEDGTVLSAKDSNLFVCRHKEWKGMPFASAIKAKFSPELADAGYNYQTETLKVKAPYFWNYLQTSFDLEEARKRLCQMIGAVLTPVSTSSIPSIWNLIGEPGSGKGVICKFLQSVFDKEAVALVVSPSVKNNRFAFSRLITAKKAPRFLLTPDISSSDVYNPTMFNMIAGGDNITVEEKCVKSQTVSGKLTWVIASNSHLRFKASGDHLAKKIVEIPFETHTDFRSSDRQVESLETKLLAEADAILSFSWGVLARTVREHEKICYALKQKILDCDYEFNPLLEMLEKHAFIDSEAAFTVYDVSEKFKEYMEGTGLGRWYEPDVMNGDEKVYRPSQLFKDTVKKWIKAHGLKSGNVIRNGRYTARTYTFFVDLNAVNESFEPESRWQNSWEYQPLAASGILSPQILAELPATRSVESSNPAEKAVQKPEASCPVDTIQPASENKKSQAGQPLFEESETFRPKRAESGGRLPSRGRYWQRRGQRLRLKNTAKRSSEDFCPLETEAENDS